MGAGSPPYYRAISWATHHLYNLYNLQSTIKLASVRHLLLLIKNPVWQNILVCLKYWRSFSSAVTQNKLVSVHLPSWSVISVSCHVSELQCDKHPKCCLPSSSRRQSHRNWPPETGFSRGENRAGPVDQRGGETCRLHTHAVTDARTLAHTHTDNTHTHRHGNSNGHTHTWRWTVLSTIRQNQTHPFDPFAPTHTHTHTLNSGRVYTHTHTAYKHTHSCTHMHTQSLL